MNQQKPFSQSCEQNKNVILECIKPLLQPAQSVLEIGSGTGQHAVHFAQALNHLNWQCSDRFENILGIQLWLDEANLSNTPKPITLDVSMDTWPETAYDAIYSANAVHIMPWDSVVDLFNNIPKVLASEGTLLLYGPFNYQGKYTSQSNANFDIWLKNQHPQSAIRDFEALDELANKGGLKRVNDYEMPANNRILQWVKG